jgi:hypothetical protein
VARSSTSQARKKNPTNIRGDHEDAAYDRDAEHPPTEAREDAEDDALRDR